MRIAPRHPIVKSAWLLPLRMITFCVVAGVVVVWLGFPSYLHAPFFAYCVITLATLTVILLLRRLDFRVLYHFLIALHFGSEILNEAGIVYTTGSLYSPFSALFLLTIVSAALVYRLVGTLLVASLVSVAYAGVTWANAFLLAPGRNAVPAVNDGLFGADVIFYSTFLHILIFYLVAFVSGYLAEKLQSQDRALHSASAELKKARLDTGDILRHLNCGLITVSPQGAVVYFNRTAETILGLSETDVAGKNCRVAFAGSLAPLADNLLSALESHEWLARSEFDVADAGGKQIPLGISTSILYDGDSGIRGVIGIFQDLTEAKRLEEKMRHADRMAAVGELSASIAHEIRNPLASISGSVEVLKNELLLDGDNDRLMSLIVKETTRLDGILSDFLQFARVGRPQLRKVEVNRIVSDVIELIRRHPAYNNHVRIGLLAESNVTYMAGDEDQLKQVLFNLIINACEAFEGREGAVQLDISRYAVPGGGDGVNLVVRDDGPGIPSERLERIFLPFYSTKKNGTGLGLSIVSRLVEALGGRIEVRSEPGHGTEFHLFFRGIKDHTLHGQSAGLSTVTFPQ